mmetsp:Transcript_17615/g.35183  ORF Transcript_17615/g.35183 Transcript_17615/m.35183 type:complete len:966 (+) Transcript_17615:97-2994(+)
MASSIVPPPPSKANDHQNQTTGRSLLDLLRSRDKLIRASSDEEDNSAEIDNTEHELLQRLHSLDVTIRRRGLFNNDSVRSQSFYTCASERSSSSSSVTAAAAAADGNVDENEKGVKSSSSSSNKRKRKGGTGSGNNNNNNSNTGSAGGLSATSYGIFLDSHSSTPFSAVSSSGGGDTSNLDEGLIVTVVCRILGVTVGRRKKNDAQMMQVDDDKEEQKPQALKHSDSLTKVALSIITSICDHAKDGMVPSLSIDAQSAFIEGDMIGSIGSSLLDALRDNILSLYYQGNEESIAVMMESFKAAASVITLLEMRLSRAEKVINGLKDATWLVLNNLLSLTTDAALIHAIQQSATILLASLPLPGASDGSPPSKVWAQCIRDGILLLRWAINGFFPMPTIDSSTLKDEATKHPTVWKEHERWLSIVTGFQVEGLDLGGDPTDGYRANALQIRIGCLTSYITSLIKMEGYPLHRANTFSSSALLLPFDSLLDVSELLLSFPLAAEGKHRSTKQRLRSTPVQGGLISPDSAMSISVELRLCGHTLFDVAMESCRGGSGALSRGRRIVGMAVANLQSSCSMALVSVVDGKRGGDFRGQRIGWLRGSIPLRIKSIQMLLNVAISLGSSTMSSVGTAMSKALVLLGGCLLEQTQKEEDRVDEWGTLGERAKLVEISSSALASCVAAFGGLIPNNVRSTIDSILHSCLTTLYCSGGSSIFAYAEAKRSILQLATNCVTVPWGDGGRSTINEIVRKVSLLLKNDADVTVASMALSTLCVVDAFMTPRAPAILIASRNQDNNGDLTASDMMRSINEKETEMKSLSRAKEPKEKKSSKKDPKVSAKVSTKAAATKSKKTATEDSSTVKTKKSKITETTKAVQKESESNVADAIKKVAAVETDYKRMNSESTNTAASNDVATDAMEVDESTEDAVKAEIKSQQEHKEDTEVGDDDDDDFSLDDFPEIVDEEPDEGDRM